MRYRSPLTTPPLSATPLTVVVYTKSGPSTSSATAAVISLTLLAGRSAIVSFTAATGAPSIDSEKHEVLSMRSSKGCSSAVNVLALAARDSVAGARRTESSGVPSAAGNVAGVCSSSTATDTSSGARPCAKRQQPPSSSAGKSATTTNPGYGFLRLPAIQRAPSLPNPRRSRNWAYCHRWPSAVTARFPLA